MYNSNTTQDKMQSQFLPEPKFREKKLMNQEIADIYEVLEMSRKAEQIRRCGDFLEFRTRADNTRKLARANFCKRRLCPMCTWRRSRKVFGQVSRIMEKITAEKNYRFLFITLTVRNVEGDELSKTIDHIFDSFHNRFLKSKEFKRISKGWFRALEVTYNKSRFDYHPHIHMVVAVNRSYFDQNRKKSGYLSNHELTELWQRCAGTDYKPIVDIRAVKPKKIEGGTNSTTLSSTIAEIAKYAVKTSDIITRDEHGEVDYDNSDHVLYTLDSVLHGRKLIAFGGAFREAHRELGLDDAENGNLVNTDIEEANGELKSIIERYKWNIGLSEYQLIEQ